jgi:hypothetical protein
MKARNLFQSIGPILALMVLSGCFGNKRSTHTTLFADGSVERKFTTIDEDSSTTKRNIFGIRKEDGWRADVQALPFTKKERDWLSKPEYAVSFTRKFSSAEAANTSMNLPGGLFQMQSELKTSFRWFYTDFIYSDTYLPPFPASQINPDDYFSEEDYAYMKSVSNDSARFDSVRNNELKVKNEKYYMNGVAVNIFDTLVQKMEESRLERKWLDSARKYKAEILRNIAAWGMDNKYVENYLVDTLHVPFRLSKEDQKKMGGIAEKYSYLVFDEFKHSIKMPFDIAESNADSVAGSIAFWKSTGLLPKGVVMQARARRFNYWTYCVTIIALGAAIVGVRRVKRRKLKDKSQKSKVES